MNNSYLFEKEPMPKHNIQLGSTILGRFGVIGLFGLAVLGLAACGGGDSSGGASSPPMTITPPVDRPDLVISSTSRSRDLAPGQKFTLSVRVRNQGDGQAPATTVHYKMQEAREDTKPEDVVISTDDTTIRTGPVPSLGPSETAPATTWILWTAPLTSGTYYYGACVDAVSGESDTGNNCSSGVRVMVTSSQPDLVIQSTSIQTWGLASESLTLRPKQEFKLSVRVRNQSDGLSPATTLRYKSSAYERISDPDVGTDVGTDSVPSLLGRLSPGSNLFDGSIILTAPSTEGDYYYGACVDPVSGESNTGNNCSGYDTPYVLVRNEFNGGGGNGGSGGDNGGGGGDNGGGGNGGGRFVTAVWPCPFGEGGEITAGSHYNDTDEVIRFRGNTCGNFWIAGHNGTNTPGLGNPEGYLFIWNEGNRYDGFVGITATNVNSSGRTVVRQYTLNFCRKSEVEEEFCGVGGRGGEFYQYIDCQVALLVNTVNPRKSFSSFLKAEVHSLLMTCRSEPGR